MKSATTARKSAFGAAQMALVAGVAREADAERDVAGLARATVHVTAAPHHHAAVGDLRDAAALAVAGCEGEESEQGEGRRTHRSRAYTASAGDAIGVY